MRNGKFVKQKFLHRQKQRAFLAFTNRAILLQTESTYHGARKKKPEKTDASKLARFFSGFFVTFLNAKKITFP